MIHDSAHAPLSFRVPVLALLRGEGPEQRVDLRDLAFEEAEDVVLVDQGDVPIKIGLVFAGRGPLHDAAPYFKYLLNHSTIF